MRAGLAMSCVGAVTWFLIDFLMRVEPYSHPGIPYWNAGVRLGLFVILATALSRLNGALMQERETSRLKTEVLGVVNHEFSNALVGMSIALAQLREVQEGPSHAQGRQICAVLDRIHLALKHTINNFLNEARIESGRFVLELRPTQLHGIIDGAVASIAALSQYKAIDVEFDIPPDIEPVRADPDALSLVMTNLIGNAVKYTPRKGRVAVRVGRLVGPERVLISVEDTGLGVPSKDLDAIFSGFYRGAHSREGPSGYGIGLKVSRDIVASHGSDLRVETNLGRGSRFFFTLQVWREPYQAVGDPERHGPRT
jgi:signal transduction histidine kinase